MWPVQQGIIGQSQNPSSDDGSASGGRGRGFEVSGVATRPGLPLPCTGQCYFSDKPKPNWKRVNGVGLERRRYHRKVFASDNILSNLPKQKFSKHSGCLLRWTLTVKSTKYFWLFSPTQLLTQGQWWSIFRMHRLQTLLNDKDDKKINYSCAAPSLIPNRRISWD